MQSNLQSSAIFLISLGPDYNQTDFTSKSNLIQGNLE